MPRTVFTCLVAMNLFAGLAMACGAKHTAVDRAAAATPKATNTAHAAPAVGTSALISFRQGDHNASTDSMFAERVGLYLPSTTGDKFLLVSLSASTTHTDISIDGEQELTPRCERLEI